MRQKLRARLPVIARAVLAGTVGVFLIHFFFLFLYENVDGYQYWAFGEYLRTGAYPFLPPMLYAKPTTISPPLYSAVLALISPIRRGDIILHAVQLCLSGLTGFFLYKTLLFFVKKEQAVIAACLTTLIPGSVIYAGYMMTENGMQFFLALYVFLFVMWVKTRRILPLSLSVFVGLLMGLWKYSFLVYGVLSLIVFLFARRKTVIAYVFPALGVLLIFLWILYNRAITGVWGLSDTRYMYAHMVLVWEGKVVPRPDNPATIRFRNYVPETVPFHDGYWTFLNYILPKVNHDWTKVDEIVGGMGIGAVRDFPLEYVKTVTKNFFKTHNYGIPYWSNLSHYGDGDPVYQIYCDYLTNLKFCTPVIMTPWTYPVWNAFVRASNWFYAWIFPLWSVVLFFPVLLFSLMQKKAFFRWLGILFLVGRLPIAMTAFTESRYLVPFYPLMTLITVAGVKEACLWRKKQKTVR